MPMIITPDRDNLDVEVQAEVGDVELCNAGFTWTAPLDPGEYNLTMTMKDSIYTVIENYSVTVVANSRPEINGISINGQILENNLIKVEPGLPLDISIDASD
ncbi:MAG: hypothetical protein KAX49_18270 [Halanaerobiales bacterium]|nr:hypothetical protein [Halanaerobiales bacterium]